jgi:hypothetical protein
VPLAFWLSFAVLMTPFLCTRQLVSTHHSLALFICPDEPVARRSIVSKCPSLADFLSLCLQVLLCSTVCQWPRDPRSLTLIRCLNDSIDSLCVRQDVRTSR